MEFGVKTSLAASNSGKLSCQMRGGGEERRPFEELKKRSNNRERWDAGELTVHGDEGVVSDNRADVKEFLIQVNVLDLAYLNNVGGGGVTEKLLNDQHQVQVVARVQELFNLKSLI
ncbi:hypothetical protein MA16_Dca002349 [Dendrobium catenatum]|uniref:Uncharacterized protein n=1 Tax=Dendrobium catenatum TaxID=906689 RepID=A0A2I0W0A1_9ASPA|nr:hypothetical protein MA16_Dca002349 [Dendrobium catenatum]